MGLSCWHGSQGLSALLSSVHAMCWCLPQAVQQALQAARAAGDWNVVAWGSLKVDRLVGHTICLGYRHVELVELQDHDSALLSRVHDVHGALADQRTAHEAAQHRLEACSPIYSGAVVLQQDNRNNGRCYGHNLGHMSRNGSVRQNDKESLWPA